MKRPLARSSSAALVAASLAAVTLVVAATPTSAQSPDGHRAPRRGPPLPVTESVRIGEPVPVGEPALDVDPSDAAAAGVADPAFLIDELPFRIEHCGSYRLDRCLRGVAGEHGITIAVDDVTVDLHGNAVVGIPGALSGIRVLGDHSGITVKNGILRRWDGDGVDASLASRSRFLDLHLLDNGGAGLSAGADALVMGCVADGNGGAGLAATSGHVADVTATNGGGDGVSLGAGMVRAATVRGNAGRGVVASGSGTVAQCHASGSGGDGIDVGGGSTVVDCAVSGSGENGIVAGEGSLLQGCTVAASTADGIVVADGAAVVSCSVRGSVMNGIRVASRCSVRDNSCTDNGTINNNGAGILVPIFQTSSRIESNVLTGNGKGIEVLGSLNLVVRNSASLNGDFDFDIADGNSFGTVVFVPGAFTGDPWANFQY